MLVAPLRRRPLYPPRGLNPSPRLLQRAAVCREMPQSVARGTGHNRLGCMGPLAKAPGDRRTPG